MRSDSEIKTKVVELLELEGDERAELVQAMDAMDIKALKKVKSDAHSVRGMLSALFWVLGYSFADIRTHVVEPSLVRQGGAPSVSPASSAEEEAPKETESKDN